MPKYRVIIAARLSHNQRNGQAGIGIEVQDAECARWAEQQGYDVVAVVADVRSGTVAPWGRPHLREWVACGCDWCRTMDREDGRKRPAYKPERLTEYDAVLAWKNDRLSRGAWQDEARIRIWAEKHGKRLLIKDGPQWPPRDKGDEWAWEAMSKGARSEWESIQLRNIGHRREMVRRGVLCNRPPFGYDAVGERYSKRLVPNDWGRAYVPEIYRRATAGQSLQSIADWLTAEGVPTSRPDGKTDAGWWTRSVRKILRNPVYTGFYYQEYEDEDGIPAKGVHRCEPLIDGASFKRADEALRGRGKRGPSSANGDAMLKGVITCPQCDDSPMYRHRCLTHSGGRKYPIFYYRCAGRGSHRRSCGNMVRLEHVDNAVDEIMHDTFNVPVIKKQIVHGHDHSAELDALKHELSQLGQLGLPWEQEDAERARLRAEYARVDALPVVPDTVEEIELDEHYSDVWDGLDAPGRGPWLAEHGFTVTASKERVTVARGTVSVTLPLVALAA
jgi:DNA invertase Pin-like site-specific DNA recombinase